MQILRCLIVEDEPLAADVIRDYIGQVPGLELCDVCETAPQALEILRNEKVDILFVDINLPHINGLDFIRTTRRKYDVIFTTAYLDFALDAFNLDAVDYLVKPIEFGRFLQAVNKVFDRHQTVPPDPVREDNSRKFYFFNVDKKRIKVYFDDIVYIESLKDYIRIHTTQSKLVTKFQIGEVERILDPQRFLRFHKSFIANTDKITAYNSVEFEFGHTVLPIGRTYKEVVERWIRKT